MTEIMRVVVDRIQFISSHREFIQERNKSKNDNKENRIENRVSSKMSEHATTRL